ncbi:hypothetical protein ANANG_G00076840 [Anguilla anguilla]|uniref:Uncharacterized protein n=1 Tax=Anguilla anguilla TaxID=7936 RepID=A0A9D3ML84_ANGAN|nr:hypothetical protein ANANG_G00076840 [Anguilla anguilla]
MNRECLRSSDPWRNSALGFRVRPTRVELCSSVAPLALTPLASPIRQGTLFVSSFTKDEKLNLKSERRPSWEARLLPQRREARLPFGCHGEKIILAPYAPPPRYERQVSRGPLLSAASADRHGYGRWCHLISMATPSPWLIPPCGGGQSRTDRFRGPGVQNAFYTAHTCLGAGVRSGPLTDSSCPEESNRRRSESAGLTWDRGRERPKERHGDRERQRQREKDGEGGGSISPQVRAPAGTQTLA